MYFNIKANKQAHTSNQTQQSPCFGFPASDPGGQKMTMCLSFSKALYALWFTRCCMLSKQSLWPLFPPFSTSLTISWHWLENLFIDSFRNVEERLKWVKQYLQKHFEECFGIQWGGFDALCYQRFQISSRSLIMNFDLIARCILMFHCNKLCLWVRTGQYTLDGFF